MAEIHRVTWEFPIMLPQIITTLPLWPISIYPLPKLMCITGTSALFQNQFNSLCSLRNERGNKLMPILTFCPLCFDCISNWNRNKTQKSLLLNTGKGDDDSKYHISSACAYVHASVKGSSLWYYLKLNVFLFFVCLPKLLGKRRIMQTGPWRQVQDVIHCFTALIHLHAVLRQHFFFFTGNEKQLLYNDVNIEIASYWWLNEM